jgi:hypothetical protein
MAAAMAATREVVRVLVDDEEPRDPGRLRTARDSYLRP